VPFGVEVDAIAFGVVIDDELGNGEGVQFGVLRADQLIIGMPSGFMIDSQFPTEFELSLTFLERDVRASDVR